MKHVCASMVLFFMLVTASTAFALNPSRTYKQLPDKYNMEYTAHTVTTSDGAKLKAWHIPSKTKSTKLILISHNGEGNMANYLRRVDQFTSIGYNVVVYDYRGFGQSSDFKIANNMYIYPHFQKDFEAMVDFCRKKYASSFDVYGWGVGAGLSLGVGWNRAEVRAIIADTPFLSMEDLEEGMKLSGTVRNVVDFGAFIDIGVKEDGLVHISKLANRFVKNPHDVVAVGDRVEVTVLSVDRKRKRIGLSMVD